MLKGKFLTYSILQNDKLCGHAKSARIGDAWDSDASGHLVTSGGNLLFLFSRAVAMTLLLPSRQPQNVRKCQILRQTQQQVLPVGTSNLYVTAQQASDQQAARAQVKN